MAPLPKKDPNGKEVGEIQNNEINVEVSYNPFRPSADGDMLDPQLNNHQSTPSPGLIPSTKKNKVGENQKNATNVEQSNNPEDSYNPFEDERSDYEEEEEEVGENQNADGDRLDPQLNNHQSTPSPGPTPSTSESRRVIANSGSYNPYANRTKKTNTQKDNTSINELSSRAEKTVVTENSDISGVSVNAKKPKKSSEFRLDSFSSLDRVPLSKKLMNKATTFIPAFSKEIKRIFNKKNDTDDNKSTYNPAYSDDQNSVSETDTTKASFLAKLWAKAESLWNSISDYFNKKDKIIKELQQTNKQQNEALEKNTLLIGNLINKVNILERELQTVGEDNISIKQNFNNAMLDIGQHIVRTNQFMAQKSDLERQNSELRNRIEKLEKNQLVKPKKHKKNKETYRKESDDINQLLDGLNMNDGASAISDSDSVQEPNRLERAASAFTEFGRRVSRVFSSSNKDKDHDPDEIFEDTKKSVYAAIEKTTSNRMFYQENANNNHIDYQKLVQTTNTPAKKEKEGMLTTVAKKINPMKLLKSKAKKNGH